MLTIRPRNAEECEKILKKSVEATEKLVVAGTPHASIYEGLKHLNLIGWGKDFIKPMYEKNMVVQMGFNTLTPILTKMLLDKSRVDEDWRSLSESTITKFDKQYDANLAKLKQAIRINTERAETEQLDEAFIKMRNVCREICETDVVVDGLRVVYHTSGLARTVFNIMIPRLTTGLEKDSRIEASTDMPFFGM